MQIVDGLNRVLNIDTPPQRIISLVPSLTELLFDLGLEEQVVGVTKFCIHPSRAKKVATQIGGTKQFDFDKIKALNPDLIIANKEENYKEGVERLMKDYPVYVSDIFDLSDATRTIEEIGKMTDRVSVSLEFSNNIKQAFQEVNGSLKGKVLYFIWQSPDMIVASDNFIDCLLNWLGLENVAGHLTRYPRMSEQALKELNPDYVLLSSEPYPFKDKHRARYQELFPKAEILLVDGEMFSWYGSRLQHAPKYFNSLPIHRRG